MIDMFLTLLGYCFLRFFMSLRRLYADIMYSGKLTYEICRREHKRRVNVQEYNSLILKKAESRVVSFNKNGEYRQNWEDDCENTQLSD